MFGPTNQLRTRVDHLQRQVRELEALVTLVAERAGIGGAELQAMRAEAEPGITPEITRLVQEGQHIAAIKAYRVETGAGLKEAKDAVDALRDRQL